MSCPSFTARSVKKITYTPLPTLQNGSFSLMVSKIDILSIPPSLLALLRNVQPQSSQKTIIIFSSAPVIEIDFLPSRQVIHQGPCDKANSRHIISQQAQEEKDPAPRKGKSMNESSRTPPALAVECTNSSGICYTRAQINLVTGTQTSSDLLTLSPDAISVKRQIFS